MYQERSIDSTVKVQRIRIPLLVLRREEDPVITIQYGDRLYAAALKGGNANKFFRFPTCGHNSFSAVLQYLRIDNGFLGNTFRVSANSSRHLDDDKVGVGLNQPWKGLTYVLCTFKFAVRHACVSTKPPHEDLSRQHRLFICLTMLQIKTCNSNHVSSALLPSSHITVCITRVLNGCTL